MPGVRGAEHREALVFGNVREEAAALECVGRPDAEQVQDRRGEIDLRRHEGDLGRVHARAEDEEGHAMEELDLPRGFEISV